MTHTLQYREDLHRREANWLASWAFQAAYSAGRQYPEHEHPLRTCFQRDRDRIIHCAAFRRLEAKTQVFSDDDSDYHRTRLTHSIEVAQIARTLARALRANEDLTEAVALAHDLGHAPFGHAGEYVLNDLMANHGGFEHNRQSLRVVEVLEHPYPAFPGLNLSYETRLCLARHSTRYDIPEKDQRFIEKHAPLEGQLADLADALAYNSHDLDDALAAGLIVENDLNGIRLYERVREKVEAVFPESHRYVRQLRCAKAIIDELATDALQQTLVNLQRFNPQVPADITQADGPVATLSEQTAVDLVQLETFLREKVYHNPGVLRGARQAQELLGNIFNYFITHPNFLPPRYLRRIDDQNLHRVICDYLAGMTDRFCRREAARLNLSS